MVYCVQAQLAFTSATRRNTVQTAIANRIGGKQMWDVTRNEAVPSRLGPNSLMVDMRFASKLDQTDLEGFIEAQATGQFAPLAGSWIKLHNCRHDESIGFCAVDFTKVY